MRDGAAGRRRERSGVAAVKGTWMDASFCSGSVTLAPTGGRHEL